MTGNQGQHRIDHLIRCVFEVLELLRRLDRAEAVQWRERIN